MNSLLPEQEVSTVSAPSKTGEVKSYFEQPERYLSRQADIKIRMETVRELTNGANVTRLLDIGCGDGSISLPFLNSRTRLTLLDFSSSMTAIAQSIVPAELSGNVEVLNEDFLTAELVPRSYDVIICLGLLAHVDFPERAIARMGKLLRPGGKLVLEFTDLQHPIGRLTRLYRNLLSLRKRPPHSVNLLSFSRLSPIFNSEGLRLVSSFRYTWWAFPWIFSQSAMYRAMRFVYGTAKNNRNAWLGHEYICLLTLD